MYRDSDGWIKEFVKRGALFIHDGKPRRPHPLLTSGKHSNGFFNSKLVTHGDEVLLQEACSDMIDKYSEIFPDLSEIDWVIGPGTGATKLAEALSQEIARRAPNLISCSWESPSKFENGGVKGMRFTNPTDVVLTDQHVLQCEDVITTGGSVGLCEYAIEDRGGIPLNAILTLVNRSGLRTVREKIIIPLIDRHMPIWEPAECPLCEQGSHAIPPKIDNNWALLNALY